MINLRSKEGILFVSYLTNYNIKVIYEALSLKDFNTFIEYYSILRFKSKNALSNKEIEVALSLAYLAIEKANYYGIEIIPFNEKKYPVQLKILSDPPPLLFVKGKLRKGRNIAIIGSRNASEMAKPAIDKIIDVTKEFGYGIVSGLAIGIDTIAHEGTIEKGGYTIAVMPNSLDSIYPIENFKLANKILKTGGALISELTFGINRGKKAFIERNRLQTALSDFVIPIEMGISSGTMHTVNYSFEQNKKLVVFHPEKTMDKKFYSFYEGIFHLIQKQRNNPRGNMILVENYSELKQAIKTKDKKRIDHPKLF